MLRLQISLPHKIVLPPSLSQWVLYRCFGEWNQTEQTTIHCSLLLGNLLSPQSTLVHRPKNIIFPYSVVSGGRRVRAAGFSHASPPHSHSCRNTHTQNHFRMEIEFKLGGYPFTDYEGVYPIVNRKYHPFRPHSRGKPLWTVIRWETLF